MLAMAEPKLRRCSISVNTPVKLEILFPILLTNENVRLQFSTAENEQCLKYTLLSSLVAQVRDCGRYLGKNIPNSYCRY